MRKQTRATAETVGLLDRGLLAPGYRGDVNVIDFDRLRLHVPEFAYDLPAGGRRLLQRADGYLHTFVAGTEIRTRRRVDRRNARPSRPRRPARPRPRLTPRRPADGRGADPPSGGEEAVEVLEEHRPGAARS